VGEHGLSFSKRVVKIHRAQIQNLFATEGQELASDGRGFGGAALDLIHVNDGTGIQGRGNDSSSSDAPERIINKLLKSWAKPPATREEGIKILRLPQLSFKIGLLRVKRAI
jgi:hypothetical protein